MAKFYGPIGYGVQQEIRPGYFDEVITERNAYGDVVRNTRRLEEGAKVNLDISVGNSISIVADAYVNEHFFAMRYIKWAGVNWVVSNVEVDPDRPRLILRLGGVYNGPTAPAPQPPEGDSGE